eukprot:Skav233644  [mRNA]  locus=scaffold2779:594320:595237:- [translate_table: standard]
MSLLGAGYDSGDDSGEGETEQAPVSDASPTDAAPVSDASPTDAAPVSDASPTDAALVSDASPTDASDPSDLALLKKRKIDISKLPTSRPLKWDPKATEEVEAPLKKAAQLAANPVGQSLLAALPPPKVTLGKETSSSIRLDLSDVITTPKEKSRVPVEGLLRPDNFTDQDEEAAQVPANVLNHPMFSADAVQPDGPSAEDLLELRKPRQFVEVNAEDMKDPDWFMNNQISGGPGYLTKKRVSDDVSMYDGQGWRQTTHANPSRVQKRKHQINWLATEAMEKEAEMMDRGSQKLLSKAQTHAKYGW